MTDKQLQKASRKELIELLYYMSQELDKLKEENERLNARIDSYAQAGAKAMMQDEEQKEN
ncbi:MAG: hypothetical protein K6B38_11555 [Ruminococcus sp.]|nr:hypothetical protein [Ruminococcus sp.]